MADARVLAVTAALLVAGAALSIPVAATTTGPAPGTATEVAELVAAAPSLTAVPSDVTPTVQSAGDDTAFLTTPSLRRCFPTSANFTLLPSCTYGDVHGRKTMVLWGDSHAFMWFPAVDAIAKKDHWRLVAVFKYGCPVADITVWNVVVNAPYPSCTAFRANVIRRINKLNPALVVMSEDFATEGAAKQAITTSEWTTALEKTFAQLKPNVKKVLVGNTIASGPYAYPAACLATYPHRDPEVQRERDEPDPLG